MTAPHRIQRRRSKGWQMPEGAVLVDRSTRWGNPFVVTQNFRPGANVAGSYIAVPTVEDAVECYRLMLEDRPDLVEAARRDLRGRDLACWCALDQPCHADILLEISNAPEIP